MWVVPHMIVHTFNRTIRTELLFGYMIINVTPVTFIAAYC